MKNNKKLFKKNIKGVSSVVATVILIALVMGLVAIVWAVVTNLVKNELGQIEGCFGNFDKVTLSDKYTCYDSSLNQLNISVSVGDTSVDEILVSVSGSAKIISFKINNTNHAYIKNLGDASYGQNLIVPGKNSGKTYTLNTGGSGFIMTPDSIKIAPVIQKNQCEVSDSISSIANCAESA